MNKNIVYLSHAEKKPTGGAKIIYQHSEIINKLKNYTSEVLHIKKNKISKISLSIKKKLKMDQNHISGWQINEIKPAIDFKYDWFSNNIKIRNNFNFKKNKDFVILPEIFAHLAEDLLIKYGIKYSIFVQNGYVIKSTNNEKQIVNAYKNAQFILSYSKNISDCIKLRFPKLKIKIIQISCSVSFYKKKLKKKNIITYMSRKLPHHSNLVKDFLLKYLPKNWHIIDLNNLDEKKVYKSLSKSKIFLSFSSFEGLGLPPIEAALAGNFVIGYTGEGGSEYWKKPIFTEINSGDIILFVKKILAQIKKNKIFPHYKNKLLIYKYSKEREIKNIKKFLKFI
jgi:hypothetical protein